MIAHVNHCSFTSNSWTTSVDKEIHWCSLTVHYICNDWVMRRCLIDIGQLSYSSNNCAIIELWQNIFHNNKLERKKVVAAVFEGGSNFQLAGRKFLPSTPLFNGAPVIAYI